MTFARALLIAAFLFSPLCASADSPVPKDPEHYKAWAAQLWQSMDRRQGEVKLPNGVATITVPQQFYYLNPQDSEKILVDVWGNPPGAHVLGMLIPAGTTPFDTNSWAVTISYEEDGHISDKDAADIDYSDMLKDMQKAAKSANTERQKQGYPPLELVGWAAPPHYDSATHKLYWAKELKFGDQPMNTLNYNIRILGRQGVLVLNFIADMSQKQTIESHLNQVLTMTNFNSGHRYEEFNPSIDKVAAYGIGALIAGKVAAKAGLIAAALLFIKKFGVLIVALIGGIGSRLFRRGQ